MRLKKLLGLVVRWSIVAVGTLICASIVLGFFAFIVGTMIKACRWAWSF